jgi:hypothetical protein
LAGKAGFKFLQGEKHEEKMDLYCCVADFFCTGIYSNCGEFAGHPYFNKRSIVKAIGLPIQLLIPNCKDTSFTVFYRTGILEE